MAQCAKRGAPNVRGNARNRTSSTEIHTPHAMLDWSRIHRDRRFTPWSVPLAICSGIYRLGVGMRLGAYATGMLKGRSLPGFVVSVGNLTAGGTGKTPAAVMLARWAVDQGCQVAVLSRGYGSKDHKALLEVSDGQGNYADVRMAGDEPLLIANAVPRAPVIISRSRYLAGMYAHEKFGSDFFVLDDGFQHLQLKRDLNLLLVDAADPFGNGHLLPWGPLREPIGQLRRADAVILTRARHAPAIHQTLPFLSKKVVRVPVYRADHEADRLMVPHSGGMFAPDFLQKKRVVGFAGIAHPEHFKKTLVESGAEVVAFKGFGDHYPFTTKDTEALIHIKESMEADFLVTTEKDWMRIAQLMRPYKDIAYLRIRFCMLPGEDGVFKMIRDGLER